MKQVPPSQNPHKPPIPGARIGVSGKTFVALTMDSPVESSNPSDLPHFPEKGE